MASFLSFWLLPSPADQKRFQTIIDTLAHTYNTTPFNPHVTIFSGRFASGSQPDQIIQDAIQGKRAVGLTCDRILYSHQFSKTLFLQFQPSDVLQQISDSLYQRSLKGSKSPLDPHLSLIYKETMTEADQQAALSTLDVSNPQILFDTVAAMRAPETFQTQADVKALKLICTQPLMS